MSSIAAVHRLYRIPELIQLHIQFQMFATTRLPECSVHRLYRIPDLIQLHIQF